MMAIYVTYGFSTEPNAVGKAIGVIGENRTLGLCQVRRGRHADAVRARHAVQLDGVDRRGRAR
jgi:hypothetical protein